jgi:DNA repair protein RecN (Recombination protein N)
VASGGELSRLSLAVQVACSAKDSRCMVFDEVDSGVGGAVAEIVGRELKALGFSGQTSCVTHLPQVARQGHHQLRVSKLTDGKTTRTTISELTMDERVEEVARMLGGKEVTGKAREHAREMLQMAGQPGPEGPQLQAQGLSRSLFLALAPLYEGTAGLAAMSVQRHGVIAQFVPQPLAIASWRSSMDSSTNSSTRPQSRHTIWSWCVPWFNSKTAIPSSKW